MINTNEVYVYGDAMVDQWWLTTSTRNSAEADIAINDLVKVISQPGGAMNVLRALQQLEIVAKPCMINDPNDIPVKIRILDSNNTQLFRIDKHDYTRPYRGLEPPVGATIVIADYSKGAINDEQVKLIRSRCPNRVWVNSRSPEAIYRSLVVDGATTLGPKIAWVCNTKEYIASRAFYDSQKEVYVTLGSDGADKKEEGQTTQECESQASEVISVCGAGDIVLAALVASEILANIDDPLAFAMSAAAISCEKPYTYCPDLTETMMRYIKYQKYE